ncbi:hypothetical protein D3C81_1950090 [compost metagenome]
MTGTDFGTQADPHAFRFTDDIVFNNPTLAPVRPDQTFLVVRRRRPLWRSLTKRESAYSYVVKSGFLRPEAIRTDIDFYIFLTRIFSAKIGPDLGCCRSNFGIPR